MSGNGSREWYLLTWMVVAFSLSDLLALVKQKIANLVIVCLGPFISMIHRVLFLFWACYFFFTLHLPLGALCILRVYLVCLVYAFLIHLLIYLPKKQKAKTDSIRNQSYISWELNKSRLYSIQSEGQNLFYTKASRKSKPSLQIMVRNQIIHFMCPI